MKPRHFTCAECRAEVYDFSLAPEPIDVCATCLALPGWQTFPELRLIWGDCASPPQPEASAEGKRT